jgi:hypothetical protein
MQGKDQQRCCKGYNQKISPKKLKVGKKVTYLSTYLEVTVKKSVKVRR